MPMNIDEFKESLIECTDGLLAAYVAACDEEMTIRKAKETEKLKENLKNLDRDQLKILLSELGLELVARGTSKPSTIKNRPLHGYKEYTYANEKYYVVPFFNQELKATSQGRMANWLKNLPKEERDQRFNTVNLLDRGIIQLVDLIAANSQAVQFMVDGQMQDATLEKIEEAENRAHCAAQEAELTLDDNLAAASARASRKSGKKGAYPAE